MLALVDRLYSFDYFISYSCEDGRDYAVALRDWLAEQGLECFLDSSNYLRFVR